VALPPLKSYIGGMVSRTYGLGRPLNAPAAIILIFATLLIAAVPVCAPAQNSRASKDDAQRVVTIISGDKTKTQTYCDILKLSQQIEQAYEKNDRKMVDELSQKTDTLKKTLGPEFLALVDGLQDIDPIRGRSGDSVDIRSTRRAVREVGVEGLHLKFTEFRYWNRELVQGLARLRIDLGYAYETFLWCSHV
jgi:hypothetical protein